MHILKFLSRHSIQRLILFCIFCIIILRQNAFSKRPISKICITLVLNVYARLSFLQVFYIMNFLVMCVHYINNTTKVPIEVYFSGFHILMKQVFPALTVYSSFILHFFFHCILKLNKLKLLNPFHRIQFKQFDLVNTANYSLTRF